MDQHAPFQLPPLLKGLIGLRSLAHGAEQQQSTGALHKYGLGGVPQHMVAHITQHIRHLEAGAAPRREQDLCVASVTGPRW